MCSLTDVCFMCTNDYNCSIVDNKIVTQVEYLLPEITVIKLGIPLGICSICEKHLHSFSKFKQASVENSLRLEARIKNTHIYTDITDKNNGNAAPGTSDQIFEETLPLEVSINEEPYSIDTKNATSETKVQNFEQIYIKEEPQEENPSDSEDNSDVQETKTKKESKADTTWKDYCCTLCKISFTSKFDLKSHMKHLHGGKIFHCTVCNKVFKRKSVLQVHLKIHTGIKDYHCSVCNKTFTQKVNLLTHMKCHSTTKEYNCSICNKLFTHNSSLTNHMKMHSGIKNYQCSTCDKQFVRKDHLVKHMKIHTGTKDFHCLICDKMFVQKANLMAHMKTHTTLK